MNRHTPRQEECHANPRLIAKAPELLRCMKRMLGVLREGPVARAAVPYGGTVLELEAEALLQQIEES